MKNKKVTVCLEALFNKLTGYDTEKEYVPAQYGYIQKETDEDKEWFDFINYNGDIPCMDGETCEIIGGTGAYFVLQEIDKQTPFKLSREEFKIATVECRQMNDSKGEYIMEKSIITLVKEHDAEWNCFYSEYQNGKRINKYSYEEVKELRKTNMVVII